MFQKIPHKERMRHIKYRDEQWTRAEEKHEREVIRQMIAEKEAAMRQQELHHKDEKHREAMEVLRQLGLVGKEEGR